MPPLKLSWAYLTILRPLQWTKNLLVFAALVFARQLGDPAQVQRALIMFVAFCLVSSALYVFNDVLDRKVDRRHPRKRRRPIASGAIHWELGTILAPILATAGLLVARGAAPAALGCLLGYLVLGVAYSVVLKRVVIVDVLVIAGGFVLRSAAGGYVIAVAISPWLLICTMLLALFLGTAKRRHELLAASRPQAQRAVLHQYSPALLDQMIAVVTSSTLMAYILYAFDAQTSLKFPSQLMPLSVPFVLYGIFRYLYLIYHRSAGEEPEVLLFKDIPLLLNLALYVLLILWIVE